MLNHLEGLRNLDAVGGDLMLVGLPGLATLEGLSKLRVVGGELHLVEVGVDACLIAEFIRGQRERGYQGPAHVIGVDPSPHCQVDFASPEFAGPLTTPASPDAGAIPAPNPTLPPITLPDIDEIRGGNHLETIHPEIALRARLLYELLEHEGIEVVFISGHRSWSPPGGRRLASWHHVGMAFDLNLTHRATMSEANRHYEADRKAWERIGELAEGLGIIWGARYDDIFHFEWHPGHHARMRQHEFDAFRDLAGQDLGNYRQGWSLYEDDLQSVDETPPCLGGCYIPPDQGLSELLDSLR
ncbi:M15 family metallopeptidase [Lujinxingia vulgaris]|uniref:M15 family metallopeptidase n=1 Tax=Lujinxingia vulgaris TaxID=2600176 RepID=A0A5C6X3U8_9DELT|nr:M15 family metallopeptidase [Lujinxingia vulgaris]